DLQDFALVILGAVHATLELLRAQVAATLRDAASLQMQSNFLRALGQLLDLLPAHEHFAFGLEDFGAAAQLCGGLVEDAVAPRPRAVVDEIREDQRHAGDGKDGQRRLLFHGSFRSALDLAQTICPATAGVKLTPPRSSRLPLVHVAAADCRGRLSAEVWLTITTPLPPLFRKC